MSNKPVARERLVRFVILTPPRQRPYRWGVEGPVSIVKPGGEIEVVTSAGAVRFVRVGAILSIRDGVATASLRPGKGGDSLQEKHPSAAADAHPQRKKPKKNVKPAGPWHETVDGGKSWRKRD